MYTPTLTATNGTVDGDVTANAVFTFQRQWVDVPEAVELSFTPANPEGDRMRRTVASYADEKDTVETFVSVATAPVEIIQTAPLGISLDNFFVLENMAAGGTIANVLVNGDTHTFVVSDPRFEIVNGQLRLAPGASFDDVDVASSVSFMVTVTDQLGGSAGFLISVVVLNVNEAPEVIVGANPVVENALDAIVGAVTDIDQDLGEVDALEVSDPPVEIDGDFPKLADDQSLNFETEPTVTVSVTATDQGGFAVTDVNDTTPTVIGTAAPSETLNGTAGNDTLLGGAGNDTLNGGDGKDALYGGIGNDILNGAAGSDTLNGGAGNDPMNGGLGNDTFIFAAGFGNDTITGFDANATGGQDVLNVADLGINAGNFAANVVITDLGNDTLVTIGANSMTLLGVNGVGANAITIDDFRFVA